MTTILLLCGMTVIHAGESNDKEKNAKVSTGLLQAETVTEGSKLPVNLLYAEQWELARSGESILLIPVIKQIVNSWMQNKDKKIQIQYPGGEEGELWVQELTDWLVSLGIPSSHMVTAAGSGADDVIKFDLIK